jgi:hypothetical protein
MRARWVLRNPSSKLPGVGTAIVASWWPGTCYLVSTIQLDSSSPLARLTQTLKSGERYEDVRPGPDVFATQVFKCDSNGWVKSFDTPLYEREYVALAEATAGHDEAVNLLAQGQLKLSTRTR